MDRAIIYPGSIPLDTDLLSVQRNTMTSLGYLAQAVLGTGTFIDGLVLSPTSPASMSITVGPGTIFSMQQIDQNAFGSLSSDTSPLLKFGINTGTTSFTLAAPTTSGQSINYLIEAILQEADVQPVVLPYYNAANPSVPYSGPNNSGVAQNTQRTQRVSLQLKAGVAANTGSQITPAVDAGYIGVYVITVNFGQTTLTSANLTNAIFPGAPFMPVKLPQLRIKLSANLNLYVSPSGNDLNSGLSPISAFLTLQKAWNTIINGYDLNGFTVTVNVANGTYSSPLSASGIVTGLGSGNSIVFVGNTSSPTSCQIITSNAHAIASTGGAAIAVAGFSVSASGSAGLNPAAGIVASQGNLGIVGAMNFGTCSGPQMWATSGGQISAVGINYSISGGALNHYNAAAGSLINIVGPGVVTLTGTPAFTYFSSTSLCGTIQIYNSMGFSGSASAGTVRYAASQNGCINTNGGGAAFFPGGTVGSTGTGGQYT